MPPSTLTKLALCAAGGAVAALTATGPALAAPQAAPATPGVSAATVLAPEKGGGGKVHKAFTLKKTWVYKRPSHQAPKIDRIGKNRIIHVKCKVRTQWGPHNIWYKLAMRPGWVNSRTVLVFDRVPYCRWHGSMEATQQPERMQSEEPMEYLPG